MQVPSTSALGSRGCTIEQGIEVIVGLATLILIPELEISARWRDLLRSGRWNATNHA